MSNTISLTNVSCDWLTLKHAVERIVDNYVMVNHELITNPELHQAPITNTDKNPHADRVAVEHNYVVMAASSETRKRKRKLPQWLQATPDVSVSVKQQAPDGVFNYASAILNDGLLLLELRDAIREGDGPRVIRC